MAGAVSNRRVLAIALPIVLSNATVPLLGAVDTGVIGQLGQAAPIGAVGIGGEQVAQVQVGDGRVMGFQFLPDRQVAGNGHGQLPYERVEGLWTLFHRAFGQRHRAAPPASMALAQL